MDEWREAMAAAKVAIRLAQDRYAAQADMSRVDVRFSVGDKVMLSSQNIALPGQLSSKFRRRWLGPYPIKRVISHVAYELQLPRTLKIHPVFHVSLLKQYVEDPINTVPAPPEPIINEEGYEEFHVQEVLKHRIRLVKGSAKLEFLVRWTGYDPEYDEWRPLDEVDETVAYDDYATEMRRQLGEWPPDLKKWEQEQKAKQKSRQTRPAVASGRPVRSSKLAR
jgi:hypothetical protein